MVRTELLIDDHMTRSKADKLHLDLSMSFMREQNLIHWKTVEVFIVHVRLHIYATILHHLLTPKS